VHFTGCGIALRLSLIAAILAALRGGKPPRRIELLLALCESELLTAVTALDLLIGHGREMRRNKCELVPSLRFL
jgi:hypothetical protein